MKTTQTELQKIADAITGTEGESEAKTTQVLLAEIRDGIAGTEPNTEIKSTQVLLGEIAQAISDNPPSPAPSQPTRSGATIYDFDGTVIATYTPAEFAKLTAYPTHPTHEYLTADGYNWTLADAKAYSAQYGYVEVGAQYRVTDGKTRLFITLNDGRLEPQLGLGINGTVDVDWGDGSEHDTMTGSDTTTLVSQSHKYATEGDYVITLAVTGEIAFLYNSSRGALLLTANANNEYANSPYRTSIYKIYIGSGIVGINTRALENCYSLTSIVIPNGVVTIGNDTFFGCRNLTSLVMPSGMTSAGQYAFANCSSLTSITISSDITSIAKATFAGCYSLTSIVISNGVTNISMEAFKDCYLLGSIIIPDDVTDIGANAFQNCYALTHVVIPTDTINIDQGAFQNCTSLVSIVMPSDITSISPSVFSGCTSLASITIPSSVTNINQNAFQGCYSLTSITIPNSVIVIGDNIFQSCYALTHVVMQQGTRSIGSSVFSNCYPLTSIIIPSSVMTIGSSAFSGCYGLGYIKFKGTTTIPTISDTSVWYKVPTDCYILVPYDYLADYLGKSNMPSSSTYLYLCYATYADGDTLPTVDSDGYTLTWYASREDARSQTNPITVGNGNEIYARGVAP